MEKAPSTRQLKIAREIQKDLAEILRSKGMAAFGGAMVTVSEVRVSPDLSIAKTYVSIFPSAKADTVMASSKRRTCAPIGVNWDASSASSCASSRRLFSIWTPAWTMPSTSRNC